MNADIRDHIEARRAFGNAVCRSLAEAIARLGFPLQTRIDLPSFDTAEFTLVTDPYTQSEDLVGFWYNSRQQRTGQIRFYGDGSFYAEYDVVQPHPRKKHHFVEAINAWGREDNIKTEAKLLDLPP